MADEKRHVRDIGLTSALIAALEEAGFEYLNDLEPLSNAEIMRLRNVGGYGVNRLMRALGRTYGGTQRSDNSQSDRSRIAKGVFKEQR